MFRISDYPEIDSSRHKLRPPGDIMNSRSDTAHDGQVMAYCLNRTGEDIPLYIKHANSAVKLVALLLAILINASGALATELNDTAWTETAKTELELVKKRLDALSGEDGISNELASIQKTIIPIRTQSQDCVINSEKALEKRLLDLESLGAQASGETTDVKEAPTALSAQIKQLENRLAACRYITLQVKDIKEAAITLERASLTRLLLFQGPGILAVLQDNLMQADTWWTLVKRFLAEQSGIQLLSTVDFAIIAIVVLGGFLLGLVGRHTLLGGLEARASLTTTDPVVALQTCAAHSLPLFTATAGAAVYLTLALPLEPMPFVTQGSYGLVFLLLLIGLVCSVFTPIYPASHYLKIEVEIARALGRRLKVLLAVALAGALLFATDLASGLPEAQHHITRAIYGAFLIINLTWIIWILGRLPGMTGSGSVRLLLTAGLLLILGAELLGYRNLSQFLITGLLGSSLALGVAWIFSQFLRDFLDSLDACTYAWQKQLYRRIGLKSGERLPGMIWLRLTIFLVLWGATGIWILRVWGLSSQGLDLALITMHEGFQIGSININPVQLGIAVVTFMVMFAAAGWIKRTLAPRWLKNTRWDRGAQEALVTVTGYLGLAFAILVALSIAGLDFRNLAIVAGALSVGIGFGLQNIVNNFVSGLILLMERPIRTGDWIVVGATEGYVRKISIRSTQIETFDRADVLVPNSELISGQVTNWMLSDQWGRVTVPVGVAYGSDTAKIKEILLGVAAGHELVVTDGLKVAPPRVLFRGFGDNSLNFELRCFIRIVDQRLQVCSDLCFAIDKAFRAGGIQIPFPQRDLHIKDWQPTGVSSQPDTP